MKVLLQHELVTGRFSAPFAANWLEPAAGLTVSVAPRVVGSDVGPDDAALLPAAEIARVQATHQIVPGVAVVAARVGPIVLETEVRPDGVGDGAVQLGEAGLVAELVARATLEPYFGIPARDWRRDDVAAPAAIRDGNAALQPLTEGAFREDLGRAWFVLTGLPLVTHVLVAPIAASPDELAPLLDTMQAAGELGHERRAEWRNAWIEEHGLDRERALALLAGLHYTLTPEDQTAIMALFARGGRGAALPRVGALQYLATGN